MLWKYTTGAPDLADFVTQQQLSSGAVTATPTPGTVTTSSLASSFTLVASKINGVLALANIPPIPTSVLTGTINLATQVTGVLGLGNIPNIPTSMLTGLINLESQVSGVLPVANVASQLGLTNIGADISNVLGIGNAAQTTATNANTALAQLLAENSGSANSGNHFIDNFNRANAGNLGGNWLQNLNGSGEYGISSNICTWQTGSNTNGTSSNIFTNGQTLTDYQIISLVISTPNNNPFFGNAPYFSFIGRSNSTGTTNVELQLAGGGLASLTLNNWVGGVVTQLDTQTNITSANSGDLFQFVCGTIGGVRVYQLLRNGAVIYNYTDSGNVTNVGSGFRYAGFVGHAVGGATVQSLPASFTTWTLADNTPATVQGYGWSLFRSSTSNQASTISSGGSPINASVLDTVQYLSNGITWSAPKITVTKIGWYQINYQHNEGSVSIWGNATHQPGLLLYNASGTLVRTICGPSVNYGNSTIISLGVSVLVYIPAAGYQIAPAFITPTGSIPGIGSADGGKLFFTGSLVSP